MEEVIGREDPVDSLKESSLFEAAGWREYFKRSRAVLLVVDAQNDVLDEKGTLSFWQVWKHARENKAVANLKRVIRVCREDHESALARFDRLIGPVVTTAALVECMQAL